MHYRENSEDLFQAINEGMLHERERIFFRNVQKNQHFINKQGGLEAVVSSLAHKHIIIIGAGPSLAQYAPLLLKYQQRQEIAIIAVDMALKPLISYGLKPLFVISCETTPVDFFSDIDTHDMHLLAFSCISSSNLRKWQGKISFYNWMIHEEPYDQLWKQAGEELGFLATGSIVTTQALALALGVDAASVLLVSNDLGFVDVYYPGGTVREKMLQKNENRLNPAESQNKYLVRNSRQYEIYREDKKYFTSAQFLAAKVWIEKLVKEQKIEVFDSSMPGCSGDYITKVSMNDYLKKFDRKKKRKKR